jgi:hypothetical protein
MELAVVVAVEGDLPQLHLDSLLQVTEANLLKLVP